MAENNDIYVTKSGRQTKIIFQNYRGTTKNTLHRKKDKMPVMPDERDKSMERSGRAELEAERAELDRQRRELENLRSELIRREAEQQQAQQRPVDRVQNGINAGDLTTIVDQVQNIHIDIKLPKFNGEAEKNPLEFLEEMEKFFKIKKVSKAI